MAKRLANWRIKAIARELIYDCVSAEMDTGSVSKTKIASCAGYDIDDSEEEFEAQAVVSDDDVVRVERAMQRVIDGIINRGRIAR